MKGNSNDEEEEMADVREQLGDADRLLIKQQSNKRRRVQTSSKYRSTKRVYSQSNLCERLFSLAKILMTDRRKLMSPATLNNLLFLKVNKRYWPNTTFVDEILNDEAQGDNSDSLIRYLKMMAMKINFLFKQLCFSIVLLYSL